MQPTISFNQPYVGSISLFNKSKYSPLAILAASLFPLEKLTFSLFSINVIGKFKLFKYSTDPSFDALSTTMIS